MTEFKNKFGHIPWYSLSEDGRKLRRVFRVVEVDPDEVSGYMIILEPNGLPRSLNYFAFDIYDTFGIDAYPFTLESVVSLRRSKLEKTLVLDKLLSPSTPLRRGCSSCSGYSSCRRCSARSTKGSVSFYCLQHILAMVPENFCGN